MPYTSRIYFGPFCCDVGNARLWRGKQVIHLTPKAFAVLSYFVEHTEKLATKDEILQAVWPETTLSETVLAVAIREIRKALGDNAKLPRFIETVHRRGYRFIGTLQAMPYANAASPRAAALTHDGLFADRDAELTQLEQWFARCLQGKRHLGFLAGEAGIGKTTLVQTFIKRIQATHTLWVGYGQCVEQYGAGEAYLPILEALGRLGQEPAGQQLTTILRRYAPT